MGKKKRTEANQFLSQPGRYTFLSQSMTSLQTVEKKDFLAGLIQSFLEAAQCGIMVLEPAPESHQPKSFLVRVANDALKSELGIRVSLPAPLQDLLPEYKAFGWEELLATVQKERKPLKKQLYYKDTQREGWFDLGISSFDGLLIVQMENKTDFRQLQQQIETLNTELRKSRAAMEEFSYAASHDLQEPLRKIHFFADRLKAKHVDSLGEDGQMMLQRMIAACGRMQVLIDDLLLYSRLTTRQNPHEEINLEELISGITGELSATIREKNATLDLEQLPRVRADKAQLRQLFANLISNSLKYSNPQVAPNIQIRARKLQGSEVPQVVPESEHRLTFQLIEVEDNGLGFEQDQAKRIFEMFYRLHGKSEFSGTGIGLAMVQKIAENHKGYVWAEGTPGKGAIFRLLLPA